MQRAVLAALIALAAPFAGAAATAIPLTPANVSVLGNETKTFSVRFLDAAGQPAVDESVQFMNDACGWFPDGGSVTNVRTDASGVASVAFTAYNQGITCWLVANAGAQARFNVLTYTLGQVYLAASTDPLRPRPGQPFTVTASVMAGLYKLYDQDVSARVLPGTASAAISPGSGNTGDAGSVAFHVTPDNRVGDYDVAFTWRSKTQSLPVRAPANPWQDMWWGGAAENGWGVSVIQHQDVLFSVIYAYDDSGQPTWFVMPGGAWNDGKTAFTGALYRPHGTPFSAYDATKFAVGEAIGRATFTFMGGNTIALDYTVDGSSGHKMLSRQLFGTQDTTALPEDHGDMWWGGPGQDGWGLALLQQYRTLFGVWFTYDASGAPTWFVMPSGYWSDAATYEGRLYRTTGSPWSAARYDPATFHSVDAGPFRLHFAGDGATLGYSIDGRSGTLALGRQPF
ncbi:MAG: hypothetical protein ACM3SO_03745 [Betaproteobacteria bacterium]